MKIKTKYHGEVECSQDELIQFPNGIPGFLEEKCFLLMPFSEDTSFLILQSVQNKNLAFVVINPFEYFKNYEFDLPSNVTDMLKIKQTEDVMILTILTVGDPFETTTANLQAPIIINRKEKLGKQVVLIDTPYKTKHVFLAEKTSIGQEG